MLLVMRKTKTPPRKADPPDTVLLGQERSRLFWLLYDNHAVLEARWRSRRIDWRSVCAWAVAEGGVNAKGEPPTPNAAKQTWHRVCHLHAREKAEREAQRRPSLVATPRQTLPPPVAAPTRAKVPETPQSDVEERIALMTAKLNRRSGRRA